MRKSVRKRNYKKSYRKKNKSLRKRNLGSKRKRTQKRKNTRIKRFRKRKMRGGAYGWGDRLIQYFYQAAGGKYTNDMLEIKRRWELNTNKGEVSRNIELGEPSARLRMTQGYLDYLSDAKTGLLRGWSGVYDRGYIIGFFNYYRHGTPLGDPPPADIINQFIRRNGGNPDAVALQTALKSISIYEQNSHWNILREEFKEIKAMFSNMHLKDGIPYVNRIIDPPEDGGNTTIIPFLELAEEVLSKHSSIYSFKIKPPTDPRLEQRATRDTEPTMGQMAQSATTGAAEQPLEPPDEKQRRPLPSGPELDPEQFPWWGGWLEVGLQLNLKEDADTVAQQGYPKELLGRIKLVRSRGGAERVKVERWEKRGADVFVTVYWCCSPNGRPYRAEVKLKFLIPPSVQKALDNLMQRLNDIPQDERENPVTAEKWEAFLDEIKTKPPENAVALKDLEERVGNFILRDLDDPGL